MTTGTSYARPLAPDRQAAEQFLEFLDPSGFACDSPFVFQVYDDGPDKRQARMFIGTLAELISTLTAANRERFAVHVTINDTDGKRRNSANVVRVRKHFVEIDGGMTLDQIQTLAEMIGLDIARVNESSPGKYHVYFNVADDAQRDLGGFTLRQKKLAALFSGGRESVDLARVLRLPGFWHQKATPFQVHTVFANPDAHAHTLADLEAAIGRIEIDDAEQADRDAAHDEDQAARDAAIEWFKIAPRSISDTETPDGTKHKKGNSTAYDVLARARDLGVDYETCIELAHEFWNPRNDPPWSDDELRTIATNVYRYARNAQGAKHPHAEAEREFAADPITEVDDARIDREALRAYQERDQRNRRKTGMGHNSRNGIVFVDADKVVPHNVDYIWRARLARGKHTVLAGEAGEGKSQILCDVTARITTGGEWPDKIGGKAPQGCVVILSAEDDPEDTLVPRLIAANADLRFVKFLKMVRDEKGERKFSLETDMPRLKAACQQLGNVVMIGIDPVSSYMGGNLDGAKNTAVRHVLDPLSDLAAELRCAILSVTHFRKGAEGPKAVHRIMDSIAFGAAPRAAFGVYQDPTDIGDDPAVNEPRIMALFKTNLPDRAKSLRYVIEETTGGTDTRTGKPVPIKALRIKWLGESDLTADAIQQMQNTARGAPKLSDAIDFLERQLADRPMLVNDVRRAADALGIKEDTLNRARRRLGFKARIREGTAALGKPGDWEYPGMSEWGQGGNDA